MIDKKTVFITGVSTGIGHAAARHLLQNGYTVFGSVRKKADAAKLADEFPDDFTAVIMDVTDDRAVVRAAKQIEKALGGATLDALVNNAGIAVSGPLAHIPVAEVQYQFDVNVLGVLAVTQAFLPLLGMDRSRTGMPGKIINISSVAGKLAGPMVGPYAMSKHAIEAFSASLRRELMMYGIDVVIVGPGPVKTAIWDKIDDIDAEQYKNTDYYPILSGMAEAAKKMGAAGLPAEDLGVLIGKIIASPKPKTRYAVLRNKFARWVLPRLLPSRTLDKIIAKQMGLAK